MTLAVKMYVFGKCKVITARENGGWHMSISRRTRYPSYDEIKRARYKFVPDDVTMAMIFPPSAEFVNIHPNCFHLWQIPNDTEAQE